MSPDQIAVLDALHADVPTNPDTDPDLIPAWDACDRVYDERRGSMVGFWTAVKRGQIRSLKWGDRTYVFREDVETIFSGEEANDEL